MLASAIETGGTSFAGYVNEFRGRAGYLDHAEVFRRQGQPCDVCGTPIVRTKVAGRPTNFCPHCQKPWALVRPAATEWKKAAGKVQAGSASVDSAAARPR
ncbi:MAG: zinc finger domain-containing protein [Streptosporangiaceae bacterium]